MGTVVLLFLSAVGTRAQRVRGELRLEVHDPHGTAVSPAGEPLAQFGQYGHNPGQLSKPTGVAVDPRGNVYVADSDNNRVQKFSP